MVKVLTGLVVILAFFLVPRNSGAAAAGKQVVIAYAAMNARVAPWVADGAFFGTVTADTTGAPRRLSPDAGVSDVHITAAPAWWERWLTVPI
jgi:hypothetical protein